MRPDFCAIVTVTRNSIHVLWEFLWALKYSVNQTRHKSIVIDNNSRDGDKQYILTADEHDMIDVTRWLNGNYLYTYGVNRGIESALELWPNLDYVCLLNPDVIVTDEWIDSMIAPLRGRQDGKPVGISGCILLKDGNIIEHAGAYGGGEHYGRDQIYDPDKWKGSRVVPWVTGACMMIDVKVIKAIGLLPEERYVHFGSDREYCHAARKAGFEVVCSPLTLQHYYGWSTRPYIINQDLPQVIKERMAQYGTGG